MPWDLMAWGFVRGQAGMHHNPKTATHLPQEAAVVLMQGGGFQVYNQPTGTGHIPESVAGSRAVDTGGYAPDVDLGGRPTDRDRAASADPRCPGRAAVGPAH